MITISTGISENMDQKQLVDIVYDLQKELRAKEASGQKERAVFEQKISLLKVQLKEGKEREINTKKMYEAMLAALNTPGNEPIKITKELKLINESHKKALMETKNKQGIIINTLKKQINDLRVLVMQQENEIKEQEKIYNEKSNEAESKQKLLINQLKEIESDNKKKIAKIEMESEKNIIKMKEVLTKANDEHSKELNKLKENYDSTLKEIKEIYEKERLDTEEKLCIANNTIKCLEEKTKESEEIYNNKLNIKNENKNHDTNKKLSHRKNNPIEDDDEFKQQISILKAYVANSNSSILRTQSKNSKKNLTSIVSTYNRN